jgi:hypothetical protein
MRRNFKKINCKSTSRRDTIPKQNKKFNNFLEMESIIDNSDSTYNTSDDSDMNTELTETTTDNTDTDNTDIDNADTDSDNNSDEEFDNENIDQECEDTEEEFIGEEFVIEKTQVIIEDSDNNKNNNDNDKDDDGDTDEQEIETEQKEKTTIINDCGDNANQFLSNNVFNVKVNYNSAYSTPSNSNNCVHKSANLNDCMANLKVNPDVNSNVNSNINSKQNDKQVELDLIKKVIGSMFKELNYESKDNKSSDSIPTTTTNNQSMRDYKYCTAKSECSSLQSVNKCSVILPVGTKLCPENKCVCVNETYYYVSLDDEIEVELENDITVCINNVEFDVISDPSVNRESSNKYKKMHSFVVKKGTKYYINDETRDPIGLTHVFDVDNKFVIKPGSQIFLKYGTDIVLHPEKNQENGIDCPMVLTKLKTVCTLEPEIYVNK